MKSKKNKYEIDSVAKCFMAQKRLLKEYELGITTRPKQDIDSAKRILDKIYLVINDLDDNSKFIIHNEIVLGKKGTWYHGFLSTPTYYRHRCKAYNDFLEYLEQ